MKFNKGQGISFFASIVLFGVFTVLVFLFLTEKTITFWLGYFFAVFAIVFMFVSLSKLFTKTTKEDKFLNVPVVTATWIYFVIQMSMSYYEIKNYALGYYLALVANLIIGLIFIVAVLLLTASANKIEKSEQHISEKVLYIKQLKNQLDELETDNEELSNALSELKEAVRFSDPMSHSQLASIEEAISDKVLDLENVMDNAESALAISKDINKLLKKRNNQCLTLKGVKDETLNSDKKGTGSGIALAGVGVTLALFLITLTVAFVIIPENKYKAANELITEDKLDEAIIAFTELGDYKDSIRKIEDIETIKLDKRYDEAIAAMESEDYENAIAIFTELGEHKDSATKIDEINEIICENKYVKAESAFNEGDYETALPLYKEISSYKDSLEKIEAISNRQGTGASIYFGIYDSEPVEWIVISKEEGKMLLLAANPIRDLPISDELEEISFEESYIAKWLNNEFLAGFPQSDVNQLIETDGLNVFIFDKDQVQALINSGKDIKCDSDWWIASEGRKGFKYVTADGQIKNRGDVSLRDKGVRPAIWVSLK